MGVTIQKAWNQPDTLKSIPPKKLCMCIYRPKNCVCVYIYTYIRTYIYIYVYVCVGEYSVFGERGVDKMGRTVEGSCIMIGSYTQRPEKNGLWEMPTSVHPGGGL